ncbi:MAG: hypothetical protein ACNA8W_14165 [Bradymonadaceae bacterium]
MKPSSLRIRLALVGLFMSASVLTACTVSVTGGLGGIGVSMLLLMLFLAGTATTQTGCEIGTSACLSIAPENNWNNDLDVGPCLIAPWDGGFDEDVTPDTGDAQQADADIHVGPCLSPPFDGGFDDDVSPDTGDARDADATDAGDRDATDVDGSDGGLDQPDADAHLGPCLSPLPPDGGFIIAPDAGASLESQGPEPILDERARILARLSDRLPADVLAKLEKKA